jgi:hypothetical protein
MLAAASTGPSPHTKGHYQNYQPHTPATPVAFSTQTHTPLPCTCPAVVQKQTTPLSPLMTPFYSPFMPCGCPATTSKAHQQQMLAHMLYPALVSLGQQHSLWWQQTWCTAAANLCIAAANMMCCVFLHPKPAILYLMGPRSSAAEGTATPRAAASAKIFLRGSLGRRLSPPRPPARRMGRLRHSSSSRTGAAEAGSSSRTGGKGGKNSRKHSSSEQE